MEAESRRLTARSMEPEGGSARPAFVLLMRLTGEGLADVEAAPACFAEGVKAPEARDGKMRSFQASMRAFTPDQLKGVVGTLPSGADARRHACLCILMHGGVVIWFPSPLECCTELQT